MGDNRLRFFVVILTFNSNSFRNFYSNFSGFKPESHLQPHCLLLSRLELPLQMI